VVAHLGGWGGPSLTVSAVAMMGLVMGGKLEGWWLRWGAESCTVREVGARWDQGGQQVGFILKSRSPSSCLAS
jgi:hypothetical protein